MKNYIKLLILALVLAALAWWVTSERATNNEAIEIGVIASLTGPGSFQGENIRKGIELAVGEINESGGIDGRLIELVFEDDGTNPKQTVSAAQKLINVDNVPAIIGGQWDFLANAMIPIVNEAQITTISPGVQYDSIVTENQGGNYFFTTYPSASVHVESVSKFFTKEDVKTAVVVAVNNDWGTAYTNMYKAAAEDNDVSILQIFRLPDTDGNDLRTEVSRTKELDPDAILLVVNEADVISFVNRYVELGLTSKVVEAEVLGDLLSTNQLSPVQTAGFHYLQYSDPNSKFVVAFEEQYSESPFIGADTGYDAAYVLKSAIERGGTTREGIAEGVRKVNIEGATGAIDFRKNNFPHNKQSALVQVTPENF